MPRLQLNTPYHRHEARSRAQLGLAAAFLCGLAACHTPRASDHAGPGGDLTPADLVPLAPATIALDLSADLDGRAGLELLTVLRTRELMTLELIRPDGSALFRTPVPSEWGLPQCAVVLQAPGQRYSVLIGFPRAEFGGRRLGLVARLETGGSLVEWRRGQGEDHYGADMALLGDLDGDGHPDLLVGAQQPALGVLPARGGYVEVVSTLDGRLVRRHAGSGKRGLGVLVAETADLDGDGVTDYLAADPAARTVVWSGSTGERIPDHGSAVIENVSITDVGDVDGDGHSEFVLVDLEGARLCSSTPGRAAQHFRAPADLLNRSSRFPGATMAALDHDGDGVVDWVTGDSTHSALAPGEQAGEQGARERERCGRLTLYSGATGSCLRSLEGPGSGDLLGRAVGRLGDLDGDGAEELWVLGRGQVFLVRGRSSLR